MKIAHEAPLSIMKDIRALTDYDYALVHLFEDENIGLEYLEFFVRSLEMGRKVILDNSIFELGKSFNIEKFKDWIKKLQPTEYIIPDVLEDYKGTIRNIYSWVNLNCGGVLGATQNPFPGIKSIGVIQGKTYEELVECYQVVDRNCDKIAIPFDFSWYHEVCPHQNKYYSMMYGRQYLIDRLLKDDIINKLKPHHLLGCSLPQEFYHYRSVHYCFIETMDSSNPVVHGLKGINYEHYGLQTKESQKLYTMISQEVTYPQFETICKNVKKFKQFTNRNFS